MIEVETILNNEQCQQLGMPTALRERKVSVFLASSAEIQVQFWQENRYLASELFVVVPPFSAAVSAIFGLDGQGIVIVDRNLKVRHAREAIDLVSVGRDLQQLISACGCDLSDQW